MQLEHVRKWTQNIFSDVFLPLSLQKKCKALLLSELQQFYESTKLYAVKHFNCILQYEMVYSDIRYNHLFYLLHDSEELKPSERLNYKEGLSFVGNS